MRAAELTLYGLAKLLYRSEVAHSKSMKEALESETAYAELRSHDLDRIIQAARRYDVPIAGKSVLDLGCNDGAITIGYLEHGAAKVLGVDPDAAAISRANQTHREKLADFHVSTTAGIPLADASIDTVLSYDVFEHVADVPGLLAEVGRVLRPAGKALIGTWGWRHPFAPHLWSTMPVP